MAEAVTEKEIEMRTADGIADGFLYQPATAGAWPGVIHLTDIGGIRPSNRSMAQRLASEGYVVLLPNVFYRTGKLPLFAFPMKFGEERTMQRLGELRTPVTPEAMERDATAYVDFLAGQKAVSGGKFGVVGFCFTGSMALRIAAARPDKIAAAVSFHGGGLITDAPASPHTVLPHVKARLYFGHAVQDRGMPAEAIEKFESALKSWGGAFESETYDGAFHGWTVSDSPVYHPQQAERAFEKLTELLRVVLR